MMTGMKRKNRGIKSKMTVAFIFMGIILSFCIGIGVFLISYRQVSAQYTERAFNSAKTAVLPVNGDSIARYLEHGKDEEYFAVYDALKDLKTAFDLIYLYVMTEGADENTAVFVFDIFSEGNDPELVADLGDDVPETDAASVVNVKQTFLTGQIEDSTIVSVSHYGWLATAYVPVFASDGTVAAVMGVDISMNRIISEIVVRSMQIVLITVAVITGFMFILRFITGRQIIDPIMRLSKHMDSFKPGDGRFDMIKVPNSGDEFQTIAKSFNEMMGDIRYYMENLKEVTADRERIATELNIATEIQTGMLPSVFPAFPGRDEFDIYAAMYPAREVGGDFYDFFFINEVTLALVIAGVSGKGIPAALFMVITKTLIKNAILDGKRPKEVFETVNDMLVENNDAGLYVTAFTGFIDIKSGRFTYINAGHGPPFIKRAGGSFELLETKPAQPLAGMEGTKYTEYETVLNAGDFVFLYTDGVTGALNDKNDIFSETRLFETINRHTEGSAEELIIKIKDEVDKFANGAEQADDITILAFEMLF